MSLLLRLRVAAPSGYALEANSALYENQAGSAGLRSGRRISSAVTPYTLALQAAAIKASRRLSTAGVGYSNIAQAARTLRGYGLVSSPATYAVAQQVATITAARRIVGNGSLLSLVTGSAALVSARRVAAQASAYGTSAGDVSFVIEQGRFRLSVSAGEYAYDVGAAGFVLVRIPPRIITGKRAGSLFTRSNARRNISDGVRNGAKVDNASGADRDNRGNQTPRPRGEFPRRRRIS